MAVTTPPLETGAAGPLLPRFDVVERVVHWLNAALFLTLMATGAAMYLAPLGQLIGRRALIEDIHVYCGLALPFPLLAGLAGPYRRALAEDLRRLNRWTAADRAWLGEVLNRRRRRAGRPATARAAGVGKFNAGQKLNGAFTAGAGLVMLGTGAIMRWYHPWPLAWRTGATFVHDWLAIGVGLVVVGHVVMALQEPETIRAMIGGRISRRWAERHAPAWLEGRDGPPPLGSGQVPEGVGDDPGGGVDLAGGHR